ncbi:hypothetical protein L6452_31101 [Arctium lappa]|uniref:Uncharacterized protein n=1 Tax=Arctium lappa TaxID=4217 RepID=A0ACB8ZKB6_ARCLA|nr:hypothetical protein L6452_31101 [Arctium lappa]
MAFPSEIVPNCIDEDGMDRGEVYPAAVGNVDEYISDVATGEDCQIMTGSDASKEVVLAFDSLNCKSVEVLDGDSNSAEFKKVLVYIVSPALMHKCKLRTTA